MDGLAQRQRPLRREEYEQMIEAGLFQNERIELIHGVLVARSPQNVPHSTAIQVLTRLLLPPLLERADVRVQLPFAAGPDSLPEPDLVVVTPTYFKDAQPDRAFLVVEVSDSSLSFDRHEKAELYARAGVPEYWIVNLVDRVIERHTEPVSASYSSLTPFRPGDVVPLLAFPDVGVAVSEVFGV